MRLLGVVVSWAPGVSKRKMSRFFNERNDGTSCKELYIPAVPGTAIALALSSSSDSWELWFLLRVGF